jgi:hypothetical protein
MHLMCRHDSKHAFLTIYSSVYKILLVIKLVILVIWRSFTYETTCKKVKVFCYKPGVALGVSEG